jgi:hypothetical protein
VIGVVVCWRRNKGDVIMEKLSKFTRLAREVVLLLTAAVTLADKVIDFVSKVANWATACLLRITNSNINAAKNLSLFRIKNA